MSAIRRMGALLLAITLGASLVACGSDSTDEASDETTTTESGGGTDIDLSDFTGECAAFMGAFAGASAAIGSAFGGTPTDDLEGAAEYFNEIAGDIPEEIRADFEIFANAYEAFAAALIEADIDYSDPSSMNQEALAELEAAADAFSAPEVEEASANVQAYLEANCTVGQ